MGLYDTSAWGVIASLALIAVGGLMVWAYGGHKIAPLNLSATGPEAEATKSFHRDLSSWFLFYGATLVVIGVLSLLASIMTLF